MVRGVKIEVFAILTVLENEILITARVYPASQSIIKD